MRFGVSLTNAGPFAGPDRLARQAERAEALGFETVWVSDHVVMPTEFSSVYPYGPPGTFTPENRSNYYEPLMTLSWIAGATRRVRLGTSVLVLPYRNPVVTAKQIATLDALSGGRVILGIGVGWLEEEFQALGQPYFRQRGSLSDEYVRIYRALWSGEPTSYDGQFYQLRPVISQPRPVQTASGGGPPIWVGGHGDRALRRTAELGDAWQPIRVGVDELRRGAERLRELSAGYGRPMPELTHRCYLTLGNPKPDAADYELFTGDPARAAASLERYAAAGCAEIGLDVLPADSTNAILEAIDRFANDIRPLLSK